MSEREPIAIHFDYFDVSDDPLAKAHRAIPSDVTESLEALGLSRAGFALAVLRDREIELLSDVWCDAGGTVIAELGTAIGACDFATLFEDGTVVKTVVKPRPMEWLRVKYGMMHHPANRYLFEAVRGSIEEVYARHVARVEAMRHSLAVVDADPMQLHFAVRIRAAEIREARMPRQISLSGWIAIAIAMFASFSAVALRVELGARRSPALVLLACIGFLVAFVPAHTAAKWLIAPYILFRRPGPPPRPASELMVRAGAVPRGRLRR